MPADFWVSGRHRGTGRKDFRGLSGRPALAHPVAQLLAKSCLGLIGGAIHIDE